MKNSFNISSKNCFHEIDDETRNATKLFHEQDKYTNHVYTLLVAPIIFKFLHLFCGTSQMVYSKHYISSLGLVPTIQYAQTTTKKVQQREKNKTQIVYRTYFVIFALFVKHFI